MAENDRIQGETPAADDKDQSPGAGWLLKISVVVVFLLDFALSGLLGVRQAQNLSMLVGIAVGRALFAPAIVVLLFQLFPRFRNTRSRLKIFLWTSVLLIL
ncbi:hypothetical protein D6779_05050, partial [Candidatus Parcubacteria bacterium]